MISLKQAISATAVVLGSSLLLAAPASAYIACNHEGGDCWHAEKRVRAPDARLEYHPDDWYFHQKWDGGDRHFRDYHEGRGYYKGGIWIQL